MKKWTGDLLFCVVLAAVLGTSILLTQPVSTFWFWISGLFTGYGLRIGMVNVWPHIFKPRLAYKSATAGKE